MERISNPLDPRVRYLRHLRQNASLRAEKGRVLVEGRKLVEELAERQPVRQLLLTDASLTSLSAEASFLVTSDVLKKIAGAQNPDGVIAEFDRPEIHTSLHQLPTPSPLLVLDRIGDPGNMGTLLRSAWAFGWRAVACLPGCCDPYNDKAVRAARGATFFLPIVEIATAHQLIEELQELKITLLAAQMGGEPLASRQEDLALVLGNEGSGVAPQLLRASQTLSIPMEEGVESLNVATAGSIMMYVLRQAHHA